MTTRVWGQSTEKKLKWVTLSAKYLPGALTVMRNSFIINENVCKAIGLAQSDKATQQFENLVRLIAEDGVSLVAIEMESDTVVGAAINKIQVKGDPNCAGFLDNQMKTPDLDPAYKELLNFMIQMENKVDIFEHYGVTKLLDHMFLSTHIDYYERGIAHGLVAATVAMARALQRGEDVAVPISDNKYPWKNISTPPVQAVISLFSSPISQKIGKSLGWNEMYIVRYDQLFYRGESYASKLDKNCQTTVYMSIKIDN